MAEISKKEDCRLEPNPNEGLPRELREEVGRMAATCQTGGCFDHISQLPIPSRESVVGDRGAGAAGSSSPATSPRSGSIRWGWSTTWAGW